VGEKPAPAWANIPEYKINSPPTAPQAEEAHSQAVAAAPASDEGPQGGSEPATVDAEAASGSDPEVGVAGDASNAASTGDVK